MSGFIQGISNFAGGIENSVESAVGSVSGGASNLFQEVLQDVNDVEAKLLGPDYPYYQNILTPQQIGMSANGDLTTLGNDIEGLISYVEVLVTGNSNASATGGPLGNKFFLKTGAKCMATDTNQPVDRYIYVDNVPTGNIPFISSALGQNFTDFEGLIPGAFGNLNVLNPYGIMQSFLSGSTPPCQELTMQTIDVNNNQSTETEYVTVVDIQNMDPCSFQSGSNPLSGKSCQQAFTNRTHKKKNNQSVSLPSDPLAQLYFASLAAVGVYVVYRLMDK